MIKEEREKLYADVMEKYKNGLKPAEIAKLKDITRMQVYNILKGTPSGKKKKLDKPKK